MKDTATKTVWITISFVLLFTAVAITNIAIELTIALCAVGMILIPYMVVRLLKDAYETSKTFSDWYEDEDEHRNAA